MKRAVIGVLAAGLLALGCTGDNIPELTGGLTPQRDITGSWEGSGSFRDNAPNPGCQWNGKLVPPSVFMEITSIKDNTITGSVRIVIPQSDVVVLAADPVLCTPFNASSSFVGNISGVGFRFVDEGGNKWEMSFTSDDIIGVVKNDRFPEPGLITVPGTHISLGRPF